MTVIAMTREMGTLGKDVAMALSVNRGLALVHHELVEQKLAEKMDMGASDVHRFLEGNDTMLERWTIDAKRLSRYTAEEVLQIAKTGNVVIRGWGAPSLLRRVPNVLRVRICAPMDFRIDVMKERLGIDDTNVVRREIERNDDAHSRTVQRFFGDDWRNPTNYHLVVNTGAVSVDACVRQIDSILQEEVFQDSVTSRGILADLIAHTRVRAAFDQSGWVGLAGDAIEIRVRDGQVRLTGVSGVQGEIDKAVELAAAVDGVSGVENRIARVGHQNIWA